MNTELALWAIESESAAGLSAEHTYVAADGHNFNCFGRSSGGRLVCKSSASTKWACMVYGHQYEGMSDSGLPTGLSIRYDGVCQNVANRIIVLAVDDIDARKTKGNAFATLMYGKFGFNGIQQYIQTVKDTGAQLIKTGEIASSDIQTVLTRIAYGQTAAAELEILHADAMEQLGVDLPDITDVQQKAFCSIYGDYQIDRKEVFMAIASKSKPTDQIACGPLKSGLVAPWAKCVDRLVAALSAEQFKLMFGAEPDQAKRAFA